MSAWKKLYIPKNLVERYTDKGVLIRFPKTSSYKGYTFWYPSKLYNDGWLICKDNFTFKIKNTRTNDTDEIGYEDVAGNIFHEMVNKFERHIPDKLDATKMEALEELKDD